MPSLPFPIHESLDVEIKIRQAKRDLGVINYQYINKSNLTNQHDVKIFIFI